MHEEMFKDTYNKSSQRSKNEITITYKLNGNALIFKEEAFKRSELKDFDLFADRIAKSLKLKYNSPADLRIFNINGQEQFAQDLAFFKDKEVIYISTGQDFDIKSYYSQYEIEKTLGAGGFGKVVLGVNKLDGEKVAIKITNPEAIENAQDLDSLFAEAETLKGLNHPNIVKFKNCFVIKKTLQAYFIMEYLEGGELLEYLREKGQLAEDEAAEIFKQILSAVDYCHRQKVIHRDLKLENILRESKDTVVFKLVDFGIAGLSDGRKSEITNAGSLNYMPPEIFLRKNVGASPALDIWALGCILYTLVVGKLPFSGPKSSDVKNMIINDEVFFPKKLVLTDEIKDLILKMMTKEPEKRIIMHEIMDHPWIRRKKFTQEQRDELKIKFPDNLPNELPEIKEVKESPKASMDKSAPKKSMSYFPNAKKPITSFSDDPKNKKPKK